jgi:tRNA (cmo5U34)-methyltransferase
LGAGTGLLSAFMLNKYPDAHLTLIDISDKMLDIAKTRLKRVPGVRYMLEDYTHYAAAADEKFDIIVSGLSIHHLTDEDKFSLYRNTYANLKPNGVFVNADQVLGHTAAVDSLYKSDWRCKVEASGLSREVLEAAYERTKLDKMTGLQTQLGWLQEIGFSDVDCVYKYFNFVVMVGRKNGTGAYWS